MRRRVVVFPIIRFDCVLSVGSWTPGSPSPLPEGLARSSRYLILAPKNFSNLRISNTRIRSSSEEVVGVVRAVVMVTLVVLVVRLS